MPETLTVQAGEITQKSGEKNGRKWTRTALLDAGGQLVGSTFDALDAKPGNKYEVEREKNGDYWNILSVKPAAPDAVVAETPQLGTGEYVKGKEAPETRAGIAAAVALKEAVRFGGAEVLDILDAADQFFDWLMSKTAAAAPEKPALPGAAQEPVTEGLLKEIGQLLVTLASHAPASLDPAWTWSDEIRVYTKANFGKESSAALTKAEAHQVIAHLEERINSVQAEKDVPF